MKVSVLVATIFAALFVCPEFGRANDFSKLSDMPSNTSPSHMRIVSLSPHLTEVVFLLGREDQLIAVSDYSDYPQQAKQLPRVASYQGADLEEIYRMQATHILAWKGGNKQSDIAKLIQSDHRVYQSDSRDLTSWIQDIQGLATFLNVSEEHQNQIINGIEVKLNTLKDKYNSQSKSVAYYLSNKPIVALGNDTWLNSLLSLCNLHNVFKPSFASFPQVSIEQILRQQPEILIAANHGSLEAMYGLWQPHNDILQATLIQANPDKLHRFTPRAIDEMSKLCEKAYSND